LSRACFIVRKTHFHFTTRLHFSGAVFVVKTDFSQHTPQPLKTIFGCPLPRQSAWPRTQPDKVSPAPRPCAHASICKNSWPDFQLAAPRALCRQSLHFALNLEGTDLPRGVETLCGSTHAFTHQPARRSHAPYHFQNRLRQHAHPLHTLNNSKRAAALSLTNEP